MNAVKTKSDAAQELHWPQNARICLVEHQGPDVQIIGEMLKEAGRGQFALASVHPNIGDAILQLRKTSDATDVILLDLSSSGSRGIETFRCLAQAAPHLPIIVLSESDHDPLAIQTVQEGAQDYLVKSDLTGRLLVRAVTFAIERKRAELAIEHGRGELERRVDERTRELQEMNQQLGAALDELSIAQSRMIQQERLHALERMASGIAHDFNNALSPILAHTEWLLMKPAAMQDVEKLSQTLVKIHESAMHCAEVVSRLREFHRPRNEPGELKPLDLRSIVEDAISLTRPCWKDQVQARGGNVRIEKDYASVPKVRGVKTELRQLLTNLMLNAIDSIKQRGVIRVSIFQDKEQICVRISDNGMGMTEEVGARCMEPFFTTKHELGSGLGLAVVYGIAQRHDAEINIESEPGVGTDVTIRLPACDSTKAQTAAMPPVFGLRILVAEDEPMIREVIGVYLGEDTHRVELAANGLEAIEKLETGRFDLVITDRSMPEVSGDRLAEVARSRDPNIRVLMLTGFGEMMTQASGKPNVDELISKPFTFESLRQGIAKAMAAPRV